MRVLLIGNYEYDRQESMQRFANLLAGELPKHGVDTELIRPRPFLGKLKPSPNGTGKWLGYLDKFVFFPVLLKRKLHRLQMADVELDFVVHICDHSNAFYTAHLKEVPHLATCHDLLAVRGALGEDTDCPASLTGRLLQKLILSGLTQAQHVACVSNATRGDLLRLAGGVMARTSSVVLNSKNYDYKAMDRPSATMLLQRFRQLDLNRPYLLHVGHNMKRKNRTAILHILASLQNRWHGNIVFAGESLDACGLQLARDLGVFGNVIQIVKPSNMELEALYSCASALIYPSRAEGFGWPIIEAQACGCPVVCSDQTSVPEVAGRGAIICGVDDIEAYARAILRLNEPADRKQLICLGYENLARFSRGQMIADYIRIYEKLIQDHAVSKEHKKNGALAHCDNPSLLK